MKQSIFILTYLFSICLLLTSLPTANAQLLNRIKNEVKNRAATRAVSESGNATDKTVDKTKKGIVNIIKGNGDHSDEHQNQVTHKNEHDNVVNEEPRVAIADYKSYDFVPGDKIIFEPDLSKEADAELPARFSIKKGNAEIQSYETEKILHLDAGGYVTVTPLIDNESYLPDQYTVEFDMMYENNKDRFDQVNDFNVYFYKPEDSNYDGYGLYRFNIHSNEQANVGPHGTPGQRMTDALAKAMQTNDVWHHVAIYAHKNIVKAYINEYRVAATNSIPTGAGKLAIRTDGRYGFKIKNFRMAAGGDDKYNKIVTDGKFITHGILFDVGKATIKPESMGTLNQVAKLMREHPDLKFEIRGHTDSDGAEDSNMILSQQRADAVKEKLLQQKIEASRLTTKGIGEGQPMDSNETAEGKANNRRVEFVKI